MKNNKRKYTKGPAWFKAHSPKALATRKIKLVREKKELKDDLCGTKNELASAKETIKHVTALKESSQSEVMSWRIAFPGLTPRQAMDKMEHLQNDRNGMMNASNGCIAEANKLRQVNAKLVEVISLLTR